MVVVVAYVALASRIESGRTYAQQLNRRRAVDSRYELQSLSHHIRDAGYGQSDVLDVLVVLVAEQNGVVISESRQCQHLAVNLPHSSRSSQKLRRISLIHQQVKLLEDVGRRHAGTVPVQHIIPQNLSLRYAEEVVCRSQHCRRQVVTQDNQS